MYQQKHTQKYTQPNKWC